MGTLNATEETFTTRYGRPPLPHPQPAPVVARPVTHATPCPSPPAVLCACPAGCLALALCGQVQTISDHKGLKKHVVTLYKKYVQNTHHASGTGNSKGDGQREYNRQRDYLEKSIDSLKRKLAKDMAMHRNDNMRLMRENVQLTK